MARRWLIGAACVLAVAVCGAGVAVASFDPSSQRGRIEAAVQRATGRPLNIAGPITVHWGLAPTLDAADVTLANMPGGTRPQMLSVARISARLALLPLLAGRLDVSDLTLTRPDILLETDADGRGNWVFTRPEPAPGVPAPAGGGPRLRTELDRLRIAEGRLTWHDGQTGRTVQADITRASLDLSGGASQFLADAVTGGTKVALTASGGTWAQMTAPAGTPWPLRLEATAGAALFDADGTVDPATRRFAGKLALSAPDLAQLGALAGRPGLPPLRDVHLTATLPTSGLPTDIALQAGPSDLGRVLPGLALSQLNLQASNPEGGRLEAGGTVAGGPWHLATTWQRTPQAVALRGLSIAAPFGDAAGDLAVTLGGKPVLRGSIVSNRIDADAIRAAFRAPAPAPAPTPAQAAPLPAPASSPPPSSPLISPAPLPWAELRALDADLQLSAGTLRFGGVDDRNAAAHIRLQDGLLQVGPASAITPSGTIDAGLTADARQTPPAVALTLHAPALGLGPLLEAAKLPGGSDATVELDVAAAATGASPRELAASVTGHAGLAMVDGDIANATLAAALGDVLHMPGAAGLDAAGTSRVRCLAIRADAVHGVITLSTLRLDSTRLDLTGSGTVNLADETLDLSLKPLLRVGGAGVAVPLKVTGSFRRPAVALEPEQGSGRVGFSLGGLAGQADTCEPELRAARGGQVGRLPAPVAAVPAKAPKPADLLRTFLR